MNPVRMQQVIDALRDADAHAPAEIACFAARSAEHRAMHYRIRHAVFVQEQAIFPDSDLDRHDAGDRTVHVLATRADEPVGAVRLYPIDLGLGLWRGDRLAVLARHRACGAGAPLVRFAVAYAGAHGGRRMVAHIQAPNVRFFQRLGWSVDGEIEEYLGLTHQPMHIGLTAS